MHTRTHAHTSRKELSETDRQTHIHIDRHTQRDRKNRQTDRQTDRQAGKQTETSPYRNETMKGDSDRYIINT